LWLCAKRAGYLPEGGSLQNEDVAELLDTVVRTTNWARQVEKMERSEPAKRMWGEVYSELSVESSGCFGAAISRAESQVLRLSMIFALADGSSIIDEQHLRAALAFWQYALGSARYLFGKHSLSEPALKILAAIRNRPNGTITRTEIYNDVFQRHATRNDINETLNSLRCLSLIESITQETGGRPVEQWRRVLKTSDAN